MKYSAIQLPGKKLPTINHKSGTINDDDLIWYSDFLRRCNIQKGEYILIAHDDKPWIMMSCPECGVICSNNNLTYIYHYNALSIKQPLKFQCCGWNGFLKNGKWTLQNPAKRQ